MDALMSWVDVELGTLTPIRATKHHQSQNDPGTVHELYLIVGERGAVHFVYMDWHPNADPELKTIDTKFVIEFGHPLYPLPADVGYHSPIPNNHWQVTSGARECEWLPSGECYGDGSASRAHRWMSAWEAQNRDDDVIWALLRDYYKHTFHGGTVQGFDDMEFGDTLDALAALMGVDMTKEPEEGP